MMRDSRGREKDGMARDSEDIGEHGVYAGPVFGCGGMRCWNRGAANYTRGSHASGGRWWYYHLDDGRVLTRNTASPGRFVELVAAMIREDARNGQRAEVLKKTATGEAVSVQDVHTGVLEEHVSCCGRFDREAQPDETRNEARAYSEG